MQTDTSYVTTTRKARRSGTGGTNEFFTPENLVNRMLDLADPKVWNDFNLVLVEPCFGNGNFLVEMYRRRLANCKTQEDVYRAISTIRGVEYMPDNVAECHMRMMNEIVQAGFKADDKVRKLIKKYLVHSDFFKWDFRAWKPKEEEPKPISYALF